MNALDRTAPRLAAAFLAAVVGLAALGGARTQDDPLDLAFQAYRAWNDQEALNRVNEVLIDKPLDLDANLLRAKCLAELGRWPESQKTLERIKTPTFQTRLLLAEAMAANGDSVGALELLDKLLLEDSASLAPRIKRAKTLLKTGQIQRAESEVTSVLQADPRNAEATFVLGLVYESSKRLREAGRTYLRLVTTPQEFDPYDGHLMKASVEGLGRTTLAAGLYDQAADWYGQLNEKFPERAYYWFSLGIAQGMKNKFQDAIVNLKKAVELEPDNVMYRIRLAEVYYSQKMYDESIEQFERLGKVLEDPSLPSLRLAEMYLEKGDLPKAIANLDMVLNLLPNSAEVHGIAGKIQEKVGDLDAAKNHYRKALEFDPLAFATLYRLALVLGRSDDAAEKAESKSMLERYQRVVEFMPDIDLARAELNLTQGNVDVLVRMAAILNAAQEYELAGAWLQRAMNTAPPNPRVLVWAGQVAANLGKIDGARGFFVKALELMAPAQDPVVVEYVRKIDAKEPLPVPLGQLIRPTTQTPADGGASGK